MMYPSEVLPLYWGPTPTFNNISQQSVLHVECECTASNRIVPDLSDCAQSDQVC